MTHPACQLLSEKWAKGQTVASGYVLYEGPSLVDGQPIVVVVTGLGEVPSANVKTGAEAQTWIMPASCPPTEATSTGADASVCFHCDFRPAVAAELRAADPKGAHPICYVNTGRGGPLNVWCRWEAGQYERKTSAIIGQIAKDRGRPIRLGSWGDPAAVPKRIWDDLLFVQMAHTGYTHQWRDFPEYAPYLMASVDNATQREEAKALGFRTYRVLGRGEEPLPGEIYCPATESTGKFTENPVTGMLTRRTCETCQLCSGAAGRGLVDIAIGETRMAAAARAKARREGEGQARTRTCGCGHPEAVHRHPETALALGRRRSREERAAEPPSAGPFYHGTDAILAPGTALRPAETRANATYFDPTKVYLTDAPHLAERYAVGRAGRSGGRPHIYELRPTGPVERDPEYVESGFGADQHMAAGATVVREVPLPGLTHWDSAVGALLRGPAPEGQARTRGAWLWSRSGRSRYRRTG